MFATTKVVVFRRSCKINRSYRELTIRWIWLYRELPRRHWEELVDRPCWFSTIPDACWRLLCCCLSNRNSLIWLLHLELSVDKKKLMKLSLGDDTMIKEKKGHYFANSVRIVSTVGILLYGSEYWGNVDDDSSSQRIAFFNQRSDCLIKKVTLLMDSAHERKSNLFTLETSIGAIVLTFRFSSRSDRFTIPSLQYFEDTPALFIKTFNPSDPTCDFTSDAILFISASFVISENAYDRLKIRSLFHVY